MCGVVSSVISIFLAMVGCIFSNTTSVDVIEESGYEEAYTSLINENRESWKDYEFDLIYFNNDYVPELVVENSGYLVSVYSFCDGKIVNIVDNWAYGAFGNHGYEFKGKSGVIRNYNTDYAGYIVTESYSFLNSDYKFDVLTYTYSPILDDNLEVLDDNLEVDEYTLNLIKDAMASYGGCFFNGTEIAKEEFDNKILKLDSFGDFKELKGNKSIDNILLELKIK